MWRFSEPIPCCAANSKERPKNLESCSNESICASGNAFASRTDDTPDPNSTITFGVNSLMFCTIAVNADSPMLHGASRDVVAVASDGRGIGRQAVYALRAPSLRRGSDQADGRDALMDLEDTVREQFEPKER